MTVINTNVGALQARVASSSAQLNMEKAMQRLSSGLRINSAADDAAGLAVATKMESQLRGINMAIRNSNDGISLVQTAESGMAEISNMVIRMRELSVQMHNGIYSDGDRSNAQLEIEALLAEIDKIANNTAFNGVKVLDGSYNSDIRAGNTNPEVINIAINRMNTDTLGGVGVTLASDAAVDPSSIFVHTAAKTHMQVAEGQVRISKDVFNQGFKDFVVANAAGTYSVSTADDGALFQVNQTTGEITLKDNVGELDLDTKRDLNVDGVYEFSVTYTVGSESVTENIALTVTNTAVKTAAANVGVTNLTVQEAETISFKSAGVEGVLSDAFKEFVAADGGAGTYAIGGTDAADFGSTISGADGIVTFDTGVFDFENPNAGAAGANGNAYQITVSYTDSANRLYTETVNIAVTDNATEDAGSIRLTQEEQTTGRSAIVLSQDDSTNVLDFHNALDRDMLSQGAKDFIAQHGGLDANGEVFGFLAVASETMAGGVATGTATLNTTDFIGINVTGTNTQALDLNVAAGGNSHDGIRFFVADNAGNGEAVLTLTLSNMADQTDATASTFTETITITVTDSDALGTGNYTQSTTGRTEQSGASSTFEGTSNGEAVTINLNDRTLFADLVGYMEADGNSGGSFTLHQYGIAPGASTAYDKSSMGIANAEANSVTTRRGFNLDGSTMTLDAGADAGTYQVQARYTDLSGNVFIQDISYTTTAAAHPSTGTVVQVSTDQTKDAVTTTTEIVGGKSTLNVNEAAEGTIQVHGGSGVLSQELSTFTTSYPSGVWSLTGADAADFEVDKQGNITSKVIMDAEGKNQHNFNLVYTMGDNVYTETIVLNVQNNTADDGTHIADVDISSQAGALAAVSILNEALNTITAAQAKLGSTQNRLQHNIDNLTALSSQTEIARGRITDADYALETSQLSKQQILSQAATSMLAQANQSKQGVLALLQ